VQARTAVTPLFRRQRAHPRNDRIVTASNRPILRHRARQPDDPAATPLASPNSLIRKPTALRFAMGLPMFLQKLFHCMSNI
jgi:hypothetical protein